MAVLQADLVQKTTQHRNHFDVHPWIVRSDRFHADLVELTAAPRRRTLTTEHRAEIEHAAFVALIQPAVRNRADDARRPFGTQRQATAAAVLKRVHLLLHNVRLFAQILLKHFRTLKNRRADFTVSITVEHIAGRLFKLYPFQRLRFPNI